MRAIPVATLLLILALSGCVADESTDLTTDDGTGQGAADGGNETADGGNQTGGSGNDTTDSGGSDAGTAGNTPPTANLSANVTTGPAPLVVGFNLTGEDVDGDPLSWTLDADGDGSVDADGTGLPASVEFTFEAAGNFTAYLNVTDGTFPASANLSIVVEAPLPAGPNLCDRPDAESVGGTVYVLDEGGTWIFRESNGIPGLQVANTHPTGPGGGGVGFANPAWADCEDGDQMLV